MSRRSSRLVSGGYYNSDEESDSSTVTSISYRENPVKVFKKKAAPRKASSRTSSRANSNASSAGRESPVAADQYDALTPSPSGSQTQATMRTVAFAASTPTPRPSLTPTRRPSALPSRSELHRRSELHFRPEHKELGQSGVDSSGYSSSEGAYRRQTPPDSRLDPTSGGACVTYRRRISSAVGALIESASSTASATAAAALSQILHLTERAGAPTLRRHMKTAAVLFLLLLLTLLGVCWLRPSSTPLFSHLTSTETVSPAEPLSRPAVPAAPLQPNTMSSSPVVDAAILSAAVEAKMQHLLVELQLKQEHLLSQMKKTLQMDLQDMKVELEARDSGSVLHLEEEVARLSRQVAGYRTDGQSAAAGLNLRIHTLEARSAQLSQDLSSIRLAPPPTPCPAPTAAPVLDHLTPELQEAMEKWFTERVKEQDAIRLADTTSSAECGRPMADKMPDFALETQGASVVSTRCSETYRIRSACVTLFGFPLWYPSESPRTVIQGHPVLLPGKCWAFHGVQGTLVISLSHPVTITHVTLDHLPRYNSPTGRIDSAPKDFEVYGMKNNTAQGTLLGGFTYDEHGESTQTFKLPNPSDVLYRFVELRVLANWGHVEYTCLYRFRVHGKMAATT